MKATTRMSCNVIASLVWLFCLGCSHSGLVASFQQSEEVQISIAWEDILHHDSHRFAPQYQLEFEDPKLLHAKFSALPPDLQATPELARLAIKHSVESPHIWESGVAGMLGTAKYYITTTSRIKDYDELYVIIVRMLSQKFGCLMIEKQNYSSELTRVRCRDLRQIVLWRNMGADWIEFYARQFDRDGYEIMVKKRRIVRISNTRML